MSKFEIEFPPALADFLDRQIEAGLYNTVSDVVQDAVRRLSESDDAKLAALRAALAPGLADIEAGRFFDGSIDDLLVEARAGAVARKRRFATRTRRSCRSSTFGGIRSNAGAMPAPSDM